MYYNFCKYAANILLFCGYFTLSVNIRHKKYAKFHIFERCKDNNISLRMQGYNKIT